MLARGPQYGRQGLERCQRSRQLSQNKLFDLNSPSMRKGRDRGKKTGKKKKEKKTDDNSGHHLTASSRLPEHRSLECRTLLPIFILQYTDNTTINICLTIHR